MGPWAQMQGSAQLSSGEPALSSSLLAQVPRFLVPQHPNFSFVTRVILAIMSVFTVTFPFFLRIFLTFDDAMNTQL